MLLKIPGFLWAALVVASGALAAEAPACNGRVVDEAHRPVAHARIHVIYADGTIESERSDEAGEFRLNLAGPLPARLQVLVAGFALAEVELPDASSEPITVELRPSRLADSVTVTASRTEIPASRSTQSVFLLPREDQETTPALSLDDYLRRVPGFTLFRRSSSFVANPTSQGVSLRGVGPSGASRSLVLADGIPLTDPFGGWVYWGRVPRAALDRVEILRGGASELYGTDALGGVIQLFRRQPAARTVSFEGYLGSLGTEDATLYASHRIGRHGLAVASEYFHTDGYNQVLESERGPVDIDARSRHHALEALWDYRLGASGRVFLLGSEYSERRGNGTPLQTNDTQIRSLAAGTTFLTGASQWTVQAFALTETFDAFFSSIALDRRTETLTRSQRVPASSSGAQLLWRRAVGRKHLLLAGADYMRVLGASDELAYTAGVLSGSARADGRQDRGGFYVQDLIQVRQRLEILAGARYDAWSNHDAFSFTRTFATGAARQTPFPSRRDTALSPKLGARLDLAKDLSLRGSVSSSFRAPTLNELYRSFRVGNVNTRENPDLGPERATSGEIGLDWGLRSKLALRGTGFWAEVDGSVASVTLLSTPTLITRQRQNLGTTRSRGIELDTVFRPSPLWTLSAGYFLSDATVRTAPAAPELLGLRLPQVPKHQAVFAALYRRAEGFFAGAQLRVSGAQFDDDLNSFRLGGYRVLDLSAGKRLAPSVELFFACENLFDSVYPVGQTPVETVGMPRRIHGGLRFRLE